MKGFERGIAAAVAAAVLAVAWPGAPAARAQTAPAGRIAIIDLQRVLARSAAGVAARDQLEKEKAAMQRQLDGHKAEIDKLRDELEKKGSLLTVEARREKQEQLERKVRDARRLVDDLQAALQKKEEGLLAKVLQEVSGVVQKVGKERGYTMILERQRSGVLFAAAEIDLTDELIKAYDAQVRTPGKP